MQRKLNPAAEQPQERMELLIMGAVKLGIHLTPNQEEQFQIYYRELTEWNSRVNLTSVTKWEDVQTRHFLDSLTICLAIPAERLKSSLALDIGTGAGFPGLPLKLAFPQLKLTLLDATAKKTAFLNHLVDSLGLDDVDIVTGRAESMAHDSAFRERYDIVLARALSNLSVLTELTLPFCKSNGKVVAQKGPEISNELQRAAKSIEVLGGRLNKVVEIDGDLLGYRGNLVVIEKIAPTPRQYPRRPGIPAKRPL